MNLEYLKENSIRLTENIEVADTDEIVSAVIEQKQYTSLMYQICDVSPIHGPTGGVFALVYENGKVKLRRNEVAVEDDALEDTGFTLEALQDLQRTFGKNMVSFVAKAFAGVSARKENTKLIAKLDEWAIATPDLMLSSPENAETNVFELYQRTASLIIKINQSNFKSLDGFVVVPKIVAASIMAMSNRTNTDDVESGLFLGSNGRIKFYLNPDFNSTTCYVGIKSGIPGQSSLVASPYQHSLVQATDPETGEQKIFNINRYAITKSALGNDMLFKFNMPALGTLPNQNPVANAGIDMNTTVGVPVTVIGTGSSDPEGASISYKWTINDAPVGSTATLPVSTASTATLTPDLPGTYTLQLVVGDGGLYSPADIVKVFVS